ncbi:hypothetical protein VaNZ11_014074 [Volvox africanus]|uniref:RING-type domain-containing protein n=1 Tax=Volvox africanus TaxID=51714 RepID=A0ABQ5SIG6_9CHLO|nr:hypothetical protein VaNZ11_014074 [Volvox africanus]
MAEILSARGRAQSRGETVGSNNGGGANTVQSSLSAAGGSLRRPSRLLVSSGPSSGLGQDHAAHTLPPLSPGNSTVSHATHRVISGTSSSRGLASGGLGSATGRPDGSNGGAGNASFGAQARSRIAPGSSTSGTGNGAGSGSGGVGVGGSSLIGTERRRVQAMMTDQTRGGAATTVASSVARTAAAGGGVASTTKGRITGRPSVRLARGSALVSGATRPQGGRGMGPVAGPGSAAARAAEARAVAAAVGSAVANSGDYNGDSDDFGIYSYIDVGRSSGGGSEPSGGGECSAGPGRALSQTHQMLQNLHTGTEGGTTAAATASGDLSSGGGSPSTSAHLGLRGTMPHVLSLNRPSSPLAAPGPRSPRGSASVASTASVGSLPHATPRPLSSRLDDVSTPPRHQQPQPTQPSVASDPLGLGIGPLSMFGPLAAAPPHTIPHSSAPPRPPSSAASRPANATATAAGSTTGFTSEPAAGSGCGHGFDPGARALLRPTLTPAGPGTGAGVGLERDLLGSHTVDVTPDSAVRPSSGSSDIVTRQPNSHVARGAALRGAPQESSASTAPAHSVAASQVTSLRALAQPTAATGAGPRMQVAAARAAARAAGRTAAPSAASGALSAAASNVQNGTAAQNSGTTGTSAASEQVAAGNRSRRGLPAAAGAALAANATTLSTTTNRAIAHHRAPMAREDVQSETTPVDTGRRNNAEAASVSMTPVAAVSAPNAGAFSLFNPRDPSPLGHAVVGTGAGNGGSTAAVARAAARRRSSNGPSEGSNRGGAGGVRGVIRQRGTGLDADAIPLSGGLGGRVGVGSNVVAASRAAAGATRLLYDSGNAFSSDDDSYGDGDSNGSSEAGGAIRHGHGHVRMPQRLFRVHLNPQAAEATTFGPTRPLGPSRPPLPHAHQHQTPAQVQQHNRLHRRSSSDDAGVVGGALVIGSGSGGFQERFLADLRRRDAQRAALMQLLMIGGEEELLRQAEEEQLALALMLSLQEATANAGGGGGSGGGGAMAATVIPRMVTVRVTHGPVVGVVAAEPGLTYEDLLTLEDVKVTTPQEVLDSLPYFNYEGARSAPDGACAICQCDYELAEQLVRLPCLHVLHGACAKKWLGEYSKKCPVCKQEVC